MNFDGETNGRVGIGIIGCGHWGFKWIKIFNETGAQVEACCDTNEEILRRVVNEAPGVNVFKEYQSMLNGDGVDAVYVATPPSTHYEIAKECLLAQKHVFVEKPITTSYEKGLELVKLAKEMDRILMVGNTYIYNKAVQELKRLISVGEIGSLRYVHSWMTNSIDMWTGKEICNYADVLWDLGPHQISITRYLVGEEPSAVSATCPRPMLNETAHRLNDAAIVNLHFKNEILATIYLNWLDYSKNRRIFVAGQEGLLNCEDISNHHNTKISINKFFHSKDHSKTNEAIVYEVNISDTLKNECQHFLSCIRSKSAPITDGEDGVSVVKILEAAQKSIAKHGSLERIS